MYEKKVYALLCLFTTKNKTSPRNPEDIHLIYVPFTCYLCRIQTQCKLRDTKPSSIIYRGICLLFRVWSWLWNVLALISKGPRIVWGMSTVRALCVSVSVSVFVCAQKCVRMSVCACTYRVFSLGFVVYCCSLEVALSNSVWSIGHYSKNALYGVVARGRCRALLKTLRFFFHITKSLYAIVTRLCSQLQSICLSEFHHLSTRVSILIN